MRKLTNIFLLVVVAVSAACQRQELENKLYVNALIPIQIDWANSGLDLESKSGDARSWDLYSASVWLFPTADSRYQGKPLEFVLSNTSTKAFTKADPVMTDFIEVPVGIYKVIIFNRSVDEFGLEGDRMAFNTESFDKFECYALEEEDSKSLFSSTKADTGTEHFEPEPLAAWSYGSEGETFEVTVDMVYMYDEVEAIKNEIYGTASKSSIDTRAEFADLDPRLTTFVLGEDVKPTALTRKITIQQYVKNLYNVNTAQCKIEGMSRSVLLGGHASGSESANHVTSYSFDSDAKDGYMKTTITTFIPRAKGTDDIEDVQYKNIYVLKGTYLPEGKEDIAKNYTNVYSPKDGDVDAYMNITAPLLAKEENLTEDSNAYELVVGGTDPTKDVITDTVNNEMPKDIEVGGGGFDVVVPDWGGDVDIPLGDDRPEAKK